MKKTRLWLIVVAAVIGLSTFIAGCVNAVDNDAVFSIANKPELQAVWFEEGDDREVKLKMPSEITEDDVTVSSSNPAAVLVETEVRDGKKVFILKAAGAGISKITAAAFDEKDSVNITVKQALKEITVTNRSALEKIVLGEERTVEYSVKPDAFDVENANVEITSSDAGVITVNGNKIKAAGKGTATLTVKAGKFSDTVEITVVDLTAPSFTAENGAVINGLAGDEIELPAALSCDGADLRANVTADCPDGITFDKDAMTVKASATGSYNVTLSVSDPRNSALTSSVNITVGVYRKIFADYNGYGNIGYESYAEGKQFVADGEQVTSFDRWDATFASFNAQPSKVYYAEIVVDSASKADWSTFYGMTHSVKGDATRWLTAYMDRGAAVTRTPEDGEESRYYSGARDFRIKDIDIVNDSNCWELHNGNQPRSQILYTYGLNRFRGIDNIDSFPCKLATARIGGFFYYFVNDYYVCAVTNDYLQDKDSVPGYFQQSSIGTEIKNIVWLNGAEAEAKFNALTDNGSKIFSEFAPSEWWKNENEASGHISHSTDASLGANYTFDTDALTGENKGIVTPYIFFDGNFTFEWEYQFDSSTAAGNWDRFMGLEVRHLRDENSSWDSNYSNKYAFLFGSSWQKNGNNDLCALVKCFSKDKPNDWDWEHPAVVSGGQEWYTNSEKLRYSVTRICCVDGQGNPVAKYTFTVERPDGSERSVWTYDDYGLDKWKSPCEPVILLWKNKGVKGTYSNVKYSVPEVPASSLSITNKDALTQKWTVGDGDRTVETEIAGALVGPAKVTSSNPEVISVNGSTLTAAGAGTATITVTIGGYRDTVEITVIPALAGVTISNKTDLTAEWLDTSAEKRAVTVAYDPADAYNAVNAPFTLTSDNTGVIKVEDDGTLSAVGGGTATVTVSVNGKEWDSVEITVKSTKVTLSLKGNVENVYGVAGEDISLPELTALSPDGADISNQVSVTCADSKVSVAGYEKVTAAESGTYTLTYSLAGADPITLTVNVQRKVFGATAGQNEGVIVTYETGAEYMQEGKEVAYLNGTGMKFAQMNVSAGKVYYAEVTFKADNAGNSGLLYGMTHSVKGDGVNRFLTAWVDRGGISSAGYVSTDRTLKVKDFDMSADSWTDIDPTTSSSPVMYVFNDTKSRTSDNGDAFPLTVAVMRNESCFYVFINGEYVMGYTNSYLADKDTVPGIFECCDIETMVTDVAYLSGEAAIGKFNALTTDNKLLKSYRPFRENNDWKYGEALDNSWYETSSDGLGFTVKSDIQENENNHMVSPYMVFDGDFTFEWDYAFAADSAQGWSNKMLLEVRRFNNFESYADPELLFGAARVDNTNGDSWVFASNSKDSNNNLGDTWFTANGAKLKYKLVRSGLTYTLTVTDADGGNKFERTHTVSSASPVIVSWKNIFVKGTYSNINWSATAAQS